MPFNVRWLGGPQHVCGREPLQYLAKGDPSDVFPRDDFHWQFIGAKRAIFQMGNHRLNCLTGGAAHVLMQNYVHTAFKKILFCFGRQIVANCDNLIGDPRFFQHADQTFIASPNVLYAEQIALDRNNPQGLIVGLIAVVLPTIGFDHSDGGKILPQTSAKTNLSLFMHSVKLTG